MAGRNNRPKFNAYDQQEIDRLKSVGLPEKIKCNRCSKNLPQAKYSIKQLTDARWHVKNLGSIGTTVKCQSCTGGKQVVEVECTMCGKTKGVEQFAKSQRSKPDTAKCFKCVEIQLADEPVNDEIYERPDAAFITPDHSNGNMPEYWSSATSTTASASVNGDEWSYANGKHRAERNGAGHIALSEDFNRAISISSSSLIDTDYAYPPAKNGNGDAWGEARTKSWHTQSNGPPSASSSFNPNAYRSSPTSVTGSSRSFASSVAERSDTSEMRSNGWAKIPAAPRNTGPPMVGSVVDTFDSDEEEDEFDDDDDDSDDDTII
ncbi:hypothetical protein BDW02DRAFT_592267 [Decorospora gaudefroyi]|uniref:Stc1 domain-containing protein n=1 Tax=Decorospora gaudefroyi TaxID=184978 RepID=A0A6A5K102_9PLEO|nr:hypothetical protein BDW02DRAFT_592267 [Decorospora gaudefroyi]